MKKHNERTKGTILLGRVLLILASFLLIGVDTNASYSLRQFSSKNGLSNSTILSMCQDRHGVIWIDSCGGLNIYDGTHLGLCKPINVHHSFPGNLIERIIKADNDVLWIQTNYGLDRFGTRRQTIQSFKNFKYINRMAISPEDDFFIIKDDGYIYYYQPERKDFCKLDVEKIHFEEVQQMAIDNFGVLWIFFSDNDDRSYIIEKNRNQVKLVPSNCLSHSEELLWVFVDDDFLYFIDSTYALYEYDLNNYKTYFIADMEAEILRRGEVSSVIEQKTDYFIGFRSSGLI